MIATQVKDLEKTPDFKAENTNLLYGLSEEEPLKILDDPYTKKAAKEAAVAKIRSQMPGPITRAIGTTFVIWKINRKNT